MRLSFIPVPVMIGASAIVATRCLEFILLLDAMGFSGLMSFIEVSAESWLNCFIMLASLVIILVNPPRRGIGKTLCDYLSRMAPATVLYSSCNAQTMAKDLALLPEYRIARVQLFDMFPHTAHYEVMALLIRHDAPR